MDIEQEISKDSCSSSVPFKSGFVALVGRPSVGKSTLLNACYGGKIAITSRVAQTTRKRMRAVITSDTSQIVLVDTPGLHKPKDALGHTLNQTALSALSDVDIVAHLIDASAEVGTGDAWVSKHVLTSSASYKILVITKADKADSPQIQSQIEKAQQFGSYDDVLVVSATQRFNIDSFLSLVEAHLPEGPHWFFDDMDVDATDEELISEFIREKILRNTRAEIPHSVAVSVDEMRWKKKDLCSIRATIMVERAGQKAIIIGRQGKFLKQIGTEARRDIEKLLGARVFLDLVVEVCPKWRQDANEIRKLGYEAE